jgi:hypothetical protein
MPIVSETPLKANMSRNDSVKAIIVALSEGWKTKTPTIPVTAITRVEKRRIRKYLPFTRLLADIGAE